MVVSSSPWCRYGQKLAATQAELAHREADLRDLRRDFEAAQTELNQARLRLRSAVGPADVERLRNDHKSVPCHFWFPAVLLSIELAATPRKAQGVNTLHRAHRDSLTALRPCRYELKNAEARLREKEAACSALQVRNEELKMQLDALENDQTHRASMKLLTLTKQHELLQGETEELRTKARAR